MARADLHMHSVFSEHPSEWFLPWIGARESYPEPEFICRRMKELGMDFVTTTDHNELEGPLRLREKHPHDVLIGQ